MMSSAKWSLVLFILGCFFQGCSKNPNDEPKNSAPIASFFATPEIGDTSTDFQFDASGCSDTQDPVSALQVRWDWENDGGWDTDFAADKIVTHRYNVADTWTVNLEVKDSGGLTGSATRQVTVNNYAGAIELQWVAIAGGTFDMGDTFGDGQGWELPVHEVALDSFQISKYEVTNAQYAKFLNEYGSDQVKAGEFAGETMIFEYSRGVEKSDETWRPAPGYDNYPVIFVTWYGAFEFCSFYGFRLPTEAEWEYVARGGSMSNGYKYSGGDNPDAVAWYDANSDKQTHHVGTKAANEVQVYDMSGNVWEWCRDWFSNAGYISWPPSNPQGPEFGNFRVLRGGSNQIDEKFLRVCCRGSNYPTYFHNTFGFRCAR
ncbi:MAG: hypothetical protein EHM72_05455 [Calditrichaeota bacterium]|nr:MAG: hypothetical protein EHM72_05455 [Calditrichota bacterium]